MKLLLFPCLVASFGGLVLHAGPVESAIVAAMKLAEQSSYSWVSTVEDDVRTYDVVGMTRPDGFTRIKMPMTDSIRRKLGRSAMDSVLDVIYHGKEQWVVETAEGWKTINELPWLVERRYEPDLLGVTSGSLGMGLPHPGISMSPPPRRRPRPRHEVAAIENYSSLQFGLNRPHEELSVIVSSHSEMQCDAGTAQGTLSEIGAVLLLVRDEQTDVQPLKAAGTFKLWIRGGVVTKYQVKLAGVLVVGGRRFEVQQTSTTLLKDIGVTKFQVPDEARQKLGE